MEERTLYEQISQRTQGNVYIGVVGPVRTGKSTFIKRFMEQLVLPNMENVYQRERAKDELPQSGSGKTIMTSEPKFVPEQAVQISPDQKATLSVRLIDSVGYLVPGAIGAEEDGQPRMVTTPWFDHEIPMLQAAELGTKKVMEEHCSIGIVITTDGTITDIAREDYVEAETRAIADMKATGKPYIVLVNSAQPQSEPAQSLCQRLREQHDVSCIAVDCLTMHVGQIQQILTELMYAFPLTELRYFLPGWVQALPPEHEQKKALYEAMRAGAAGITQLREAESAMARLLELDQVQGFHVTAVDLGTGTIDCTLDFPETLFYQVLSEQSGFEIVNDAELMALLRELAGAKREYDKVAAALAQVNATGYGVVMPAPEQLHLEQPQIIHKNGSCAVRLRASAPSIHMLRADIETELSPMVGDEQQSAQLMESLLGEYEENTQKLWQSNIFGKSLYELVSDGLNTKIQRMPDDVRMKLKQTLSRIINENTGGLICIML